MENGVRGYALTGDRAQLEPYERARAEIAPAGRSCSRCETEPGSARASRALIASSEQLRRSAAERHRSARRRPRPRRARDRARPADASAPSSDQLRGGRARRAAAPARSRERACATARSGSPPAASCSCWSLIALLAVRRRAGDRRAGQPAAALRARARRRPLRRAPAGDRPAGDGRARARLQPQRRDACSARTERHLAELDAVFRDSPLGLAFLDLDLRFLRVNEALAGMNQGRPPSTSGARSARSPASHDVEAALRRWSRPASRCSTSTWRSTAAASWRATSRSATTAASCSRSARR